MFIVFYLIILLIGCSVLVAIYIRRKKDSDAEKNLIKKETVNDFMNVKNIINNQLYTRDDHLCCYIKIEPVNIDLMSDKEMRFLQKSLTAEFSNLKNDFKLTAVSKPEDNTKLVGKYSRRLQETDNFKRKKLFRLEIQASQKRAKNQEAPTREYYYMLWKDDNETENEFLKRVIEFKTKFTNCHIPAEIIKTPDIIQMIEATCNPQYAVHEDLCPELNFTFLLKKELSDEQ